MTSRFSPLWLALFGIVLMAPAFALGHIVGHSSILNVNWAEGFQKSLAEGNLYPRYLPTMNGGAGSPVFYFYGPLPFYVSAPFTWLTGSAKLGVICTSCLLLIASGFAFLGLAKRIVGEAPAFWAALLYMVLPYHFAVDVWYRSALGEQAAFVFMPLCLGFALRLETKWCAACGLALAYAGLLFSHLPSALLFTPPLCVFILALARHKRSIGLLLKAGFAGVAGVGLASIYILPALSLQDMIQPGHWLAEYPPEHLFFGNKALQDFSVFLVPVGALIGMLVFLLPTAFVRGQIFWALGALISVVLTTRLAAPLWEHSGIFLRAQYPWRLFAFVDLCVAMLFAHAMTRAGKRRGFAVALAGIVAVLSLTSAAYAQYVYATAADSPSRMTRQRDELGLSLAVDATEYLPACLAASPDSKPMMSWDLAQRVASASGEKPRLYYPFLVARQGGAVVPTACDPATGFAVASGPEGAGPITWQAETLPVERVGTSISISTFVLLLAVAAIMRWRRAKDDP